MCPETRQVASLAQVTTLAGSANIRARVSAAAAFVNETPLTPTMSVLATLAWWIVFSCVTRPSFARDTRRHFHSTERTDKILDRLMV